MRRSSIALIAAVVLVGLVGSQVSAVTCVHDYNELVILCEWDWGCWLNPFTPDGQWWTYEYWHYTCDDNTSYWAFNTKWESGGCCTP